MVSLFLFQNGIRGVKEIAMMGMGLGPHTYPALSLTFLISFFHRNIFLSRHTWFGMWKLRETVVMGMGLVAPCLSGLFPLISTFQLLEKKWAQIFLGEWEWGIIYLLLLTWHIFLKWPSTSFLYQLVKNFVRIIVCLFLCHC